MRIYIPHVYVYIYIHTHIYIYTHKNTHKHTSTKTRTYSSAQKHINAHTQFSQSPRAYATELIVTDML